jgi:hypothetical protein
MDGCCPTPPKVAQADSDRYLSVLAFSWSAHSLMHFYDIALRIMKEHLMPFFRKG